MRILRLIKQRLKVGITDEWVANVCLHYVFDCGAHRWRRKASGDVIIMRYADDTTSRRCDRRDQAPV
jgi:hypothetical protein